MDNNKIKELINNGINNATHSEIWQAYSFITGKQPSEGCSNCFKRTAIRTIINYYKKL